MLTAPFELAMRARPALRPGVVRLWYELLSRLDRDGLMPFMNYGYLPATASMKPSLRPAEERHRTAIQLYRHVAGGAELGGREVLEVGSGRGGGAAHLAQSLAPRRYIGLDFAQAAVRFCQANHRAPGLAFVAGDAEALPFAAATFDAIINIESSHTYLRPAQFFAEVRRVLRPGGHFLFADFRPAGELPALRAQLAAVGLALAAEEEITAGVLRALDADHEQKLAMIRRHAPRPIRARFARFAGVRGSPIHEAFRTGARRYYRFVLRRP